VQAALQAEDTARREQERAMREREKEQARAKLERERARDQERQRFGRERERISQERERIAREHAQQLREQERRTQEHAREQERVRERRQRELEQQQREREREHELLQRQRQQEQERLLREKERVANDINSKAARVTTFAAQLEAISAQQTEKQSIVEQMRAELQALRDIAFPDEAALSKSEHLQSELEERETEMRSGLTVAEELYNRAVLEAERRRAEIARLEQEIEDDLGPVELDSAAPRQLRLRLVVQRPVIASSDGATEPQAEQAAETQPEAQELELVALPEVDSLPDGFEKEIRRLKNQMRYIGNVNPNAPQEYAELKERHAFLTEQAADLTLAIERLHQAIHELDAMMQQKFQETFNAINTEFKKYFAMLFGGGTARLELTDPADLIRSGIEISARPPGKRQAQLVLLSGGERSLTAAALIFAILRVSPTPFCVMDEVDAALDEANVGRFRDGLKELAAATQFIVITHNRVTMEGARAIYGVSMGEDGISQVLSLKLEQAVPQAASA
jgi:chromosome segregation protein